ncbi:MAG TPA: methyl-accepting chemotaxis protein, partial [Lachnoclostridium sp.]|nr:methyl-accepting chemotaxis protein [Lachnoclostridium sp.]
IRHSVTSVAEGEKLADETAKVLHGVAEQAELVEQAIRGIEESSSQQVQVIEQINQGLYQVSAVVQTNAATAEESSSSSEELAAQAQMLQQEVGRFRLLKEEVLYSR